MTKSEGLKLVEKKVEDFSKNEKIYLSKDFQETEARNRFIDPFFSALGWELEQTGLNRQFWDVIREFSQKDDSSTKKPDYAFRVKQKDSDKFTEKFFVEAKAPWVPLTEAKPVFQAKSYSFSSRGKTPIVILTDFQEFRVFNGLERPRFENPLQGLIKGYDLKYSNYLDKWDLLWDTFSKEAVYDGSIEQLAGKVSKTTKTLDQEFLSDITEWREILAKNIAVRNKKLTVDEINEAVQRILDRFVFIRNLEDRNIEDENLLFNLINRDEEDAHLYKCIVPLFRKLDGDYNGILFKQHFSEEIDIDNKTIKDIVKSMCYPNSPFRFDRIEPEILGRIYEQFLGSKIRLTDEHRAKVEEKPEVRHAGGVYYTPEYIVKYIVENTLGEKIKGKSPDEIKNIKILDPACGSGSFLLGAFDYLIEYHKMFYAENKNSRKYKDDFIITPDDDIRLTMRKKSEIIKNNIFGVDIDLQATEVAIMSLYLKLLDEGFDKGQMLLFMKGHILPDMTNNIKCGNSLIETDYFNGQIDFDNVEWKKVNPYDWNNTIKFDIIIGNPPYVDSETMTLLFPNEREYISNKYETTKGNWDLYIPFIEKSFKLLNYDGRLSFITPNKWLSMNYGSSLRNYINKYLIILSDFTNIKVFSDANICSIVFVAENKISDKINIKVFDDKLNYIEKYINKTEYNNIDNFGLYFSSNLPLINKLLKFDNKLGAYCDISGAFTTSEAYELIPYISEYKDSSCNYLKFINTGTLERFHTLWGVEYTTYLKTKYNKPIIRISDLKKHFPKRFDRFNRPKIIISGIRHFESVYDEKVEYIAGKSTSVLINLDDKYNYFTILSILNSKLISYFLKECYSSSGMDGGINFSPDMISSIPIPYFNDIDNKTNKTLEDIIHKLIIVYSEYYKAKSVADKDILYNQIKLLENNINSIIYDLYKLTDDDIHILNHNE